MGRRIISISLLLLLTAPVLGTYCWLYFQKAMVKHETKEIMIRGLEREKLVLLKFTKNQIETDLEWEEPGEFEYLGKMYDLVEKINKGDTLYYWCWPDEKETQLNKQLADLTTNALNTDQQRRENQDRFLRYLKSIYFQEKVNWRAMETPKVPIPETYYFNHYTPISLKPPVPPPQIV